MKNIKRSVKEFKKQFKIKKSPTNEQLLEIIKELGFTSLEYENNEMTLKAIDRTEAPKYTHSFSYTYNGHKTVFYRGELVPKDSLYVFAHEIGHIYLNHLNRSNTYSDTPVNKEIEANMFAEYLLGYYKENKNPKLGIAALIITIIIALSTGYALWNGHESEAEYIQPTKQQTEQTTEQTLILNDLENVAVALDGYRYHKLDCFHVKQIKNPQIITAKEATEQRYTPCKDCFDD